MKPDTPRPNARRILRGLLAGEKHPKPLPQLGEWSGLVETLADIRRREGLEAARRAFNAAALENPALYVLVSAEDEPMEQPESAPDSKSDNPPFLTS